MAWDALVGREVTRDYYDPDTWEVFLRVGEIMDQMKVDRLEVLNLVEVEAEFQGLIKDEEVLERWTGLGCSTFTTIARVLLKPGTGELRVNGQPVWEYFRETPRGGKRFLKRLLEIETVKEILGSMEGIAHVVGSSPDHIRQAYAVSHGIARALICYDQRLKTMLKKEGYGGMRVKGDKCSKMLDLGDIE